MSNYKDTDGVQFENLLTNSGFGVFTFSANNYTTAGTIPAVGDTYTHDEETCSDDAGDDESADWSETGGGAIAWVDATHYTFTGSAADEYVHSAADFAALTAGKLYELSITFADAANAQTIQIGTFTTGGGATGFTALGVDITTTGSEVAHVRHFEAVGTETRLGFKVTSDSSGANFVLFTDTMLHEVAPGYFAANIVGTDLWGKNNAMKVLREHNGANTKDGSFYALKCIAGLTGDNVHWPSVALNTKEEFYQKFAGRTVTFGVWVKTSEASSVRLDIDDGSSHYSSYHTGSGTYEWLEISADIDPALTYFLVYIYVTTVPDTVYLSQPMLVFGSAIGQGNYVQPPGEVIRFEKDVLLTDYDDKSLSDEDNKINVEAQSNGMIPKGVSELFVTLKARDAVPAANIGVWVGPDTTYAALNVGDVGLYLNTNVAADQHSTNSGWVRCDTGGDFWIFLNASDVATLDIEIRIQGARIR